MEAEEAFCCTLGDWAAKGVDGANWTSFAAQKGLRNGLEEFRGTCPLLCAHSRTPGAHPSQPFPLFGRSPRKGRRGGEMPPLELWLVVRPISAVPENTADFLPCLGSQSSWVARIGWQAESRFLRCHEPWVGNLLVFFLSPFPNPETLGSDGPSRSVWVSAAFFSKPRFAQSSPPVFVGTCVKSNGNARIIWRGKVLAGPFNAN